MDFLHHGVGLQQVGFAGARRATAHIHAPNGGPVAQNDGAAGGCLQVGVVPDADAWNIGNIVVHDAFAAFLLLWRFSLLSPTG
jgi:hypothetical protein